MATVLVDGKEVVLPEGQKLNGIQVARMVGTDIPHYCWHPGLTVVASCRMCLCETGTRDPATGKITMLPKLVPACQTPATDNTVFVTDSDKIRNARAMVEEDLLIDHPIDCPICDKAGECLLQDYHFEHGRDERRADIRPFTSRRRPMGDTVTLFVDRCVMCTRCVRFTREISGDAELMVINRGAHEEIDVFPGYPLDNKLSGNVVDLCPVGALGDKDFLYQQRVWFMKKHDGVCAGCSTGCSITVEENQDRVYRLKPRENPEINQWWMCDEGRYGYHHVHSSERLTEPRRKTPTGEYEPIEWSPLLAEIDRRLREVVEKGEWLAAIVSPHLTVEEAYLLVKYFRSLQADARFALGPVPSSDKDETFKNGFTIHAEKCPNRRGVEEILKHFSATNELVDTNHVADDAGLFYEAVWASGGYSSPSLGSLDDCPWALREVRPTALIVQDMFRSKLWDQADYQLPGASFAERAGSYVNFANHLQSFDWAIRPPAGVWTEGQIFWRLLKLPGLYNPKTVLAEIATTIPFFAAAQAGVPPTGVKLTAQQPEPAQT
jgi:NADH-quinone oxidoreductase subunit G